jgi:undecaprenyl-diphosphatase
MELLDAMILGFIQGIAEWLPISSEAMVTLAGRFIAGLGYSEALGMAIWLHSGTLIAALAYFHKDVIDILKSVYEQGADRSLMIFLLITTISSALVAFPLLFLAFSIVIPEALTTIVIGLFLVLVAFMQKERKGGLEKTLDWGKAVLAGLVQGLAVLPGLSRSGLTISALLGQRFPVKQAFRLSFLMSIPVSFGAQVALPIVKEGFSVSFEMLVGAAVAAIIGYLTIGLLMDFAERVNFFRATLALGLLVIIAGLALL